MRRLAAGCAVLLALAQADIASAALAPNYERLRELGEILGSDDVMQKLNHEVVDGIEATGSGSYRVWSVRCSVVVKLVGEPYEVPAIPGPWRFKIQVGEPQCH
jgi:hypothetical protein